MSSARATAASVLLAGALAFLPLIAGAAERRVALIRGDVELLRALSLALSAWEVDTIAVDTELPQASQPQAVVQARRLARRLHLEAVVWLSDSSSGALLWVYDSRTGEVTTRVLDARPPLDDAAAAGVALSVKTVLKQSVEPPLLPPQPLVPQPRTPLPISKRSTIRAAIDAHGVAERHIQARLALSSLLWVGEARRVGFGLRTRGGTGVAIDAPPFFGRYREVSFGPLAELRVLTGEDVSASMFLAGALQMAMLKGTLAIDGAGVVDRRYNLSVHAGGQIGLRLSDRVTFGLTAEAAALLRYQRYLVEGTPVFAPWRVSPAAGGHLAIHWP